MRLRASYDSGVRRPQEGHPLEQAIWLVEVTVVDGLSEPWLLVTDWPVRTAQQARG